MVASFLTAADVVDLTIVNESGFATELALQNGGTSLLLSRWNSATQDYVTIGPQQVTVEYANRAEKQVRGESATEVLVDGWFVALAPFDVKPDDLFALGAVGDEMRGVIVVVLPPDLGVQRAGWRLRLGEMN